MCVCVCVWRDFTGRRPGRCLISLTLMQLGGSCGGTPHSPPHLAGWVSEVFEGQHLATKLLENDLCVVHTSSVQAQPWIFPNLATGGKGDIFIIRINASNCCPVSNYYQQCVVLTEGGQWS